MQVFTDGACSGNPGPGGWGWVTLDGRTGKGGAAQTTNQRMELQAVLEAVTSLTGPLEIHSDSTYVVKCFNDRWYEGWKKRGWKNSAKKPVANRDLWEPLIDAYLARADEITFTWVKGHAGNEYNEIADQLAVAARDEQMAAVGTDAASRTGASAGKDRSSTDAQADVTAMRAARETAPWPVERGVWIVGSTQLDADGHAAVARAVDALRPGHDILISGLRRGAELVGAERAMERRVALAVVLPFANPADRWPSGDRQRFDRALQYASNVITLEGSPDRPGDAVATRNSWIRETVLGAIVVEDSALATELDEQGLSVRVVIGES